MDRVGHEHCGAVIASLERERDARIAALEAERDALKAHYDAAGPEHNLLALLDLYHDERDEWEHRHAQVQARVEALEADMEAVRKDAYDKICALERAHEAELAEARGLLAKRANVRVTAHDVWLRERERRTALEADLRAVVAGVKAMKQWRTLQLFTTCPDCDDNCDHGIQADVIVNTCNQILARPGVKAVLP